MAKKSNIYTRTGDAGFTSLVGNTRVPKFDERIEAYGTLDELKSNIGLIRDLHEDAAIKSDLFQIIRHLFVAESRIAADSNESLQFMPAFEEDWVRFLEIRMDEMDAQMPKLTAFILPTGSVLISQTHIARTICRRAERQCIATHQHFTIEPNILNYLNRLSDYLFVLARYSAYLSGINDYIWQSK